MVLQNGKKFSRGSSPEFPLNDRDGRSDDGHPSDQESEPHDPWGSVKKTSYRSDGRKCEYEAAPSSSMTRKLYQFPAMPGSRR